MKHLILAAFSIGIFTSCSDNGNSKEKSGSEPTTANSRAATNTTPTGTPISKIVDGYLQLKNGLVNDNPNDAAAAGSSIVQAFDKLDKAALTSDQKRLYEDIEEDAREHAEHISKNASNIPHQREHFDMLSKDVYELVKVFGAGQSLYQDSCPMYNDGKGATWLSEIKEIKNPYYGKGMLTCGTVKEELK